MTKSPKQRSPQIEASQKALRVKRANEARRPQPNWVRRESLSTPRETETPSAPERLRTSDRSQGPPWLLDRHQVCALANASYPTIWTRMRAGTSRVRASSAASRCGFCARLKNGWPACRCGASRVMRSEGARHEPLRLDAGTAVGAERDEAGAGAPPKKKPRRRAGAL
jgi:hypothetical protein